LLPEGYEDKRTDREATPFPSQFLGSKDDIDPKVQFDLPPNHEDKQTYRKPTPFPSQQIFN